MRPGTRRSVDEAKCPPHEIAALAQILEAAAFDEGVLLVDTGLDADAVRNPATRVSIRQILQSFRNALQAGAGEGTAFAVGRALHPARYGMYGYAILSCRTLRAATRLASQYQPDLTPTIVSSFHEEQDEVVWRFDTAVDLNPDDPLYRFLLDLHLAAHLGLCRERASAEFRPLRVSLRCSMPADIAAHESELQCPVSFRRPFNELRYPASFLDRPADPLGGDAEAFAKSTAERLLAMQCAQGGMAANVVRLLASVPGQFDDMDTIARKLGTTTRTLRRRLIAEGTSFQYLLAWVYSQIAKEYLRATRLTTADIGAVLGFNDASNFRHAFRRWTGHTTGEYRPRLEKIEMEAPAGPPTAETGTALATEDEGR